jgi:hypothetical protein
MTGIVRKRARRRNRELGVIPAIHIQLLAMGANQN